MRRSPRFSKLILYEFLHRRIINCNFAGSFTLTNTYTFFDLFPFQNYDWWWLIAAIIPVLIGWFYYFHYFSSVKQTAEPTNSDYPPVSVVICARNAALILERNLPLWLEQDYPQFEIVVVDDCSGDETAYLLVTTAEREPLLKYVLLDPLVIKNQSKKLALSLGIKKAQYEHLLLTDADCIPSSNQWIKHMATQFSKNTSLVLGVSPVNSQSNSFLERMVQYENLMTAMNYLGMSIKGSPYMGVGRNLAYTKTLYNSVGGFSAHHHIPAGDDDLFVQSVANDQNTQVVIHPDAYCPTNGPQNFKHYWRQKMRHLFVGKFYTNAVKFRLGLFSISQLLFWIISLVWLFAGSSFLYPTLLIIIKITPEWIIFAQKGKLLNMKKANALYPLLNFIQSFWYIILGTSAFFKKKIIW